MDEITVMFELERGVFEALRDAADMQGVSPADLIRESVMRDLGLRSITPVDPSATQQAPRG